MKVTARRESIKFWREQVAQNHLELLHARYVTHSFSRHAHETFAIGVIEQGALKGNYQGDTKIAPAGSIVVINPHEVHTGCAADETGWTYRMLYLDLSVVENAAFEAVQQHSKIAYFPLPVIQDQQLAHQFLKLHQTLENATCTLEKDSRLLWTLAQLIARHAGESPIAVGDEPHAIKQVREYLASHYTEKISLDAIAQVANLSPYYLIRTFRKCVGLPPHEYLTQIRVSRAKILLLQGYKLAQVAHNTGFADQSHLTRHFKRIVGVTPGQYQHQGQ